MPDHAGMHADDAHGAPVVVAEPVHAVEPVEPAGADTEPSIDLDRIEADLADVQAALARLDSGEYWRDELTGEDLPDALLAERPTARRASA